MQYYQFTYFNSSSSMRLNFQLKKINIDPVVHLQILRHADQYYNRCITGQIYGALYDDQAQITNILPFPDRQKMSTKQQLQTTQRRYDEYLSTFNLDQQKLGWYLVSYKRNFWDELESIKFYQSYINTSFFLVFDYKARQLGANPYKAYRLNDQFALKTNFKWSDLQKCNLEQTNPFQQIPVQVKKNEIFQALMLFNKDNMLKTFQTNRKNKPQKGVSLKENIEQFLQAFEEHGQIQKSLKQSNQKGQAGNDRTIGFSEYCQYLGQALKLQNYEKYFKQYEQDLKKYGQVFQTSE